MELEKTLAAFAFTSLVKQEYVESCEPKLLASVMSNTKFEDNQAPGEVDVSRNS